MILCLMERHQQLCRKAGSTGGGLGRQRVKTVLKEEWHLLNFRTEELGSFPLRKRGLAGLFTCSEELAEMINSTRGTRLVF